MMIYGGVGAGPKLLRDVWKMSFDIDTGKAKWKQVQKSRGNYLHVAAVEVLLFCLVLADFFSSFFLVDT